MKKSLLTLLGVSCFIGASPASAQMFRPPVPAAQAQAEDDNRNTAFNDAVSARGDMPQDSAGDDSDFGAPEPSVSASFSQGSTSNNLPPPNDPPPETPQEQATAQAVQQPQMQKQNIGPAQYQGAVSAQSLNPAANAGS